MLTDSQKQFFMELETTFNTPGWHRLKQGWQEELDSIPEATFQNAEDIEYVKEARIRWRLLQDLVDLPDEIEKQREALDSGDADEADLI